MQSAAKASVVSGILLLVFWLLSFVVGAQPIPFEHVVIDRDARGHREVGDMDGDGLNDIAAVNYDESGDKLVWYRYPDWKKNTICEIGTFGDFPAYRACDMEIGDVDGDGDLDVVGRIGKPGDDVKGINSWFENPRPKGDPARSPWKRHDIGESEYVKDIELADFNRDAKLDVATRTHDLLHIWLQADGDRWSRVTVPVHKKEGMEVGDLDRDGDPDVVLGGYWIETPDDLAKGKWVEHNIDDKWWKQKRSDWWENCCKVAVADMNGDGRLDVLFSSAEKPDYPVSWYEAPHDPKNGKWKEHVIGQIDYCHTLKVADMDNDGDIDVVAAEMPRYEAPYPVVISVNQGDSMTWKVQVLATTGNYSGQVGDIGNDGDMDIVGLRSYDKAPIEMWENKTNDGKSTLDSQTHVQMNGRRRSP